jgi:hypothetical protein
MGKETIEDEYLLSKSLAEPSEGGKVGFADETAADESAAENEKNRSAIFDQRWSFLCVDEGGVAK